MAIFSNMVSVFFLVLFVSIVSSNPAENILQKLTQSIDHFASDFNKETSKLKEHAGKNLIMSPMSTHMVLSLLSLGAQGNTLEELTKGLYLTNNDFTKQAYKQEMNKLSAFQDVTVKSANKLYAKKGIEFTVNPVFRKFAGEVFKTEMENIDFTQKTSTAAKINAWVEDKTDETIKDFIDANDLGNSTALVLVNAMYFKGDWKKKFSKYNTKGATFGNDKTNVDMMHQMHMFNYAESADLDAKVLEVPFEGDEMSMLFVLPNKFDGLAAVEEKMQKNYLSKGSFDNLKLKPEFVDVSLPKFQINSTIDLAVVLPKLGMGSMFTKQAELGGLLINPTPIKVTKAFQKAFIDVNEKGASAGAASGLEGELVMLPSKHFTADHPFYFAIVSEGQIFFSGKFTNNK